MSAASFGCVNITSYTDLKSCGFVNIDEQQPRHLATPLYGYLVPTIVLVTVVTNTVIMIVMSRPNMNTATNQILIAMAFAEMATGLTCLPWFVYYYTFNHDVFDLNDFWCSTYRLFALQLPTLCHTAATWLTVFLAIHRYFYISLSNTAPLICTVLRTRTVIVVVCIAAALVSLPDLLTFRGILMDLNGTALSHTHACLLKPWILRDNWIIGAYYWFRGVTCHFLPATLLIVFTISLVSKVQRSNMKANGSGRQTQTQKDRAATNKTVTEFRTSASISGTHHVGCRRHLRSTTKMLILVILIFVVIEVPESFILIMHALMVSGGIPPIFHNFYSALNRFVMFRNIFILAVYPLNFAIYCGMSGQFRHELRWLYTTITTSLHKTLPKPKCEPQSAVKLLSNGSKPTEHRNESDQKLMNNLDKTSPDEPLLSTVHADVGILVDTEQTTYL